MRIPLQLAALCSLLAVSAWPAPAQQLPALPPTVAAPPAALPAAKAKPPRPHRAQVNYSQGRLQVSANDSSLNQILVQIASATGLKISGGVADERVYGSYGPADIASVLARLLDGSGSNLLLREDARRRPTELILTPRNGGPTPPSPATFAQSGQDAEDRPPQPAARLGQSLPAANTPAQAPLQGNAPAQPSTAAQGQPSPAATTTQQSPNGVKTPQQIYDQLIQLQKQNTPTQIASAPESPGRHSGAARISVFQKAATPGQAREGEDAAPACAGRAATCRA